MYRDDRVIDMENKKNESKRNGLRSEARASYTIKRSIPLDVIAGVVSVVLALAVWFFTA